MNEPWSGALRVAPSVAAYVGPGGETSAHCSPAHVVVLGALERGGIVEPCAGTAVVIPAGRTRSVRAVGADVALVYLDVRRFARTDAEALADRWAAAPVERWSCDELIAECTAAPRRRVDARALRAAAALASDADLVSASERVGLSASRVSHLIADNFGVSARSLRLWLRFGEAIDALATGASVSAAAHGAGFADTAHFSRSCRTLLGLPPSTLRRAKASFAAVPGACARAAAH